MMHLLLRVDLGGCNDKCMSQQPEDLTELLKWDLSDRLRKSLAVSKVGVSEMAEALGVNRMTVSRWLSGAVEPKLSVLRRWAMRAGVPLEWIVTGVLNDKTPPPSGEGVPNPSFLSESNRRPFHYE